MKKLAIAAAALLLAGCAAVPKDQPKHNYTKPAKVVQAAPVEAITPNQVVKKRWYDRFKVHPKWFHK